jgi:hypothetical protein
VQWAPTREGYLSFLAESKVMYEALESIVAEAPHESCALPRLVLYPLLWWPSFACLSARTLGRHQQSFIR